MKQEITVQFGQTGEDFMYHVGRDYARVNKQPPAARMSFYDVDWPPGLPGKVIFRHGLHTLTVHSALGVMLTEDLTPGLALPIGDIHIHFGLSNAELMPHDEARLKVMALLADLQSKGWRQYYNLTNARVKAKSSLLLDNDSPDARYVPTFEEWMDVIYMPTWKLWADGVHMEIMMQRDSDRLNPYQPGAYFLSMTLQTEESFNRLYFPEKERVNWKALLPQKTKELLELRTRSETEARAKGLEIDTQYQDPPILTLQIPSITAKVGQPCPKGGLWQASLPTGHPGASYLADSQLRIQQVSQGQAMPEVYTAALMPAKDAAAHNAAIVWTWVKAL